MVLLWCTCFSSAVCCSLTFLYDHCKIAYIICLLTHSGCKICNMGLAGLGDVHRVIFGSTACIQRDLVVPVCVDDVQGLWTYIKYFVSFKTNLIIEYINVTVILCFFVEPNLREN